MSRDVSILIQSVGPMDGRVSVPIVLDYLKEKPVADVFLTRDEALRLIVELVTAVRRLSA